MKVPIKARKREESIIFPAIELLNRAIARNSNFLLAYCRLTEAHDELYFCNVDRTESRLALAKSAIDSAFRLKPDSGEAHFALGRHLYHGFLDYDRAREELGDCPSSLSLTMRASLNGSDTSIGGGTVGMMQHAPSNARRNWIRETLIFSLVSRGPPN